MTFEEELATFEEELATFDKELAAAFEEELVKASGEALATVFEASSLQAQKKAAAPKTQSSTICGKNKIFCSINFIDFNYSNEAGSRNLTQSSGGLHRTHASDARNHLPSRSRPKPLRSWNKWREVRLHGSRDCSRQAS